MLTKVGLGNPSERVICSAFWVQSSRKTCVFMDSATELCLSLGRVRFRLTTYLLIRLENRTCWNWRRRSIIVALYDVAFYS